MKYENLQPQNYSPLDPITHVLAGAPGTEIPFATLMPEHISLYERREGTETLQIRADHNRMTATFKKDGIQVVNMREVIGNELAEKVRHPFSSSGKLLAEQIRRAEQLHEIYGIGSLDQVAQELEVLLKQDILAIGEMGAIAINAALTRCIDPLTGSELPFDPTANPLVNFFFWRDPVHITGNQLVTNKMLNPIRQPEVVTATIGLSALGLTFQSLERPSLEGGDTMPWEINNVRYAAQGKAERTSEAGLQQWYQAHKKLWSPSGEGLVPVVVDGPSENTQSAMHLDTYMAQVGRDAIIHCGEITRDRTISKLVVGKDGQLARRDPQPFAQWIEANATYIYDMTRPEQELYAPNVLTDAGNVYITREGTDDVTKFILAVMGRVTELRMNQLTNAYGGVHCSTTEIRKADSMRYRFHI